MLPTSVLLTCPRCCPGPSGGRSIVSHSPPSDPITDGSETQYHLLRAETVVRSVLRGRESRFRRTGLARGVMYRPEDVGRKRLRRRGYTSTGDRRRLYHGVRNGPGFSRVRRGDALVVDIRFSGRSGDTDETGSASGSPPLESAGGVRTSQKAAAGEAYDRDQKRSTIRTVPLESTAITTSDLRICSRRPPRRPCPARRHRR